MKADFNFDVTDIQVIANNELSAFMIRCQTVDQLPSGPQLSGKWLHVTMTQKQAMSLLSILYGIQKTHALLVPTQVKLTTVPPAKDRN